MTVLQYRSLPKQRRHKYGAKRTVVDGIKFDSKGEALRWIMLKHMVRSRQIRNLERQVVITLHAPFYDGVAEIGHYVADFKYSNHVGDWIIEDYKGFDTPLSKWKRKHAEAEHNITILLTGPAAKKRRRSA